MVFFNRNMKLFPAQTFPPQEKEEKEGKYFIRWGDISKEFTIQPINMPTSPRRLHHGVHR
jgi:hypothetical protein